MHCGPHCRTHEPINPASLAKPTARQYIYIYIYTYAGELLVCPPFALLRVTSLATSKVISLSTFLGPFSHCKNRPPTTKRKTNKNKNCSVFAPFSSQGFGHRKANSPKPPKNLFFFLICVSFPCFCFSFFLLQSQRSRKGRDTNKQEINENK